MAKQNSVTKSAFLLSLAGVLSKCISILYLPLLRTILGEKGYGLYCQVLEVFLFIYSVTTVGAQPAVTKVVAEYIALEQNSNNKGNVSKILSTSLKMYFKIGLIGGIILSILSIPLSIRLGKDSIYGIIALAPCILVTCLLSVYRGFLQGYNNMNPIGISQIVEQFFNVLISLLSAYLFMKYTNNIAWGVCGAQIGTSLGALISILYIKFTALRKVIIVKDKNNSFNKISKKLFLYSIPIIINSGLQNFGGVVDMLNVKSRLLISGINWDNADILYGYYGAYKTLIGVPMVIITAVSVIILPSISKCRIMNDIKKILISVKLAYKVVLIIVIPATFGLSVVAELLYISLFNNNHGFGLMTLGSFILILMALTQIQTSIMQGLNKLYYLLKTFFIGIIAKIFLNYIFVSISDINIYGVLIGNCAWYLIPLILNHRMICECINHKISIFKYLIRPIIAATAMIVPLILINKFLICPVHMTRIPCIMTLAIEISIAVIIYFYTLIFIHGLHKNDIQAVSPKLLNKLPKHIIHRMK